MDPIEARRLFQAHKPWLKSAGVSWDGYEPQMYLPDEWRRDYMMAYDAQPASITTPSAGVPWIFTNVVDPEIYHIFFAKNEITAIIPEERRGTWADKTIIFEQIENGGEVSSYDDFGDSGLTTVNADFPMRQQYLFQINKIAGDLEIETAGAARINLIAEKDRSAALIMQKFENLAYAYGVTGLYNYGLLNDPALGALLTPSTKSIGGTAWQNTSTFQFASPNEIYSDIQYAWTTLVTQTQGKVDENTKVVFACHPSTLAAMKATNIYGLNAFDLVTKNFPNMRFQTCVQYGALTASNPQGQAGGNMFQIIAEEIDGMKVAFCAYGEKMRAHPIVRGTSHYKQKLTGGIWGTVIRIPSGIVGMIGV